MTVFGEPIALPKLEAPSNQDVDKWHAVYVEVSAIPGRRYRDLAALEYLPLVSRHEEAKRNIFFRPQDGGQVSVPMPISYDVRRASCTDAFTAISSLDLHLASFPYDTTVALHGGTQQTRKIFFR